MDTIKRWQVAFSDPILYLCLTETRNEIVKLTRAITSTATFLVESGLYKIADSAMSVIKTMGRVVAGYNTLFALSEVVGTVQKAISAEKPKSRNKAIFRSVVHMGVIMAFAAQLAGIAAIVSRILFPLSVIDTALHIRKAMKNEAFYRDLRTRVQDRTYIYRNRKIITKKLKFTVTGNDKDQAEKLANCIDTKRAFGMANSALKVAGLVIGALTIFTPVGSVVLGAAAGTAVAGLALFETETFVTNR